MLSLLSEAVTLWVPGSVVTKTTSNVPLRDETLVSSGLPDGWMMFTSKFPSPEALASTRSHAM